MSKDDLWKLAQVAISCMPVFVMHPAQQSSPHGPRRQPQTLPARGRSAASAGNVGSPHRLPASSLPSPPAEPCVPAAEPRAAGTRLCQNAQTDCIFPFFAKTQKICCMSPVPPADAFSVPQVSGSALGTARATCAVRPQEERLPRSPPSLPAGCRAAGAQHTPASEQRLRAAGQDGQTSPCFPRPLQQVKLGHFAASLLKSVLTKGFLLPSRWFPLFQKVALSYGESSRLPAVIQARCLVRALGSSEPRRRSPCKADSCVATAALRGSARPTPHCLQRGH